jgi:hypothetical protein
VPSLRKFENRVTRRVFGPKRGDVTGDWRRLHTEELRNLYSSLNIIRLIMSRIRWTGRVARMGERRGVYRFWWDKRPLGTRRQRRKVILN